MSEISSSRPAGLGRDSSSTKAPAAYQARTVRRYLSAVEASKRGKGPKRTSDAVGNRITKIDELLVSADPLTRVHLTQERIELHAEYVRLSNGNQDETAQLERDFISVARSYGDRNGLTYAAWRQVGVDAKVLERAGIRRAEKKPPPAATRAAAEKAVASGNDVTGDQSPSTKPSGKKSQGAPPPPEAGDVESQDRAPADGPSTEVRPSVPPSPSVPPATTSPPPPSPEPPRSTPRPLFGVEAPVAGTGDVGDIRTPYRAWESASGEPPTPRGVDDVRSRPGDEEPWWSDRRPPPPPPDGAGPRA